MLATVITMPTIFFGHGSPMNAIETNSFTQYWRNMKFEQKPKAILSISAHWETSGIRITSNKIQKTIHDFGGFPQALYDVQYTPQGSEWLCKRIQELIPKAQLDGSWGLDHGTWSVLAHLFPNADVPVVQLSLDTKLSDQQHYELAKSLGPLRNEGVLIIGSGNIVHNLREVDWSGKTKAYDWAKQFNEAIIKAVLAKDHKTLINYKSLEGSRLAAPTRDHYLPLLYIVAQEGEPSIFFESEYMMGSLNMASVIIK